MDDCQSFLKDKEEAWEKLCARCGSCCGAFDDPCEHLKKENQGRYYCDIYNNRLGQRHTVGGNSFKCEHIKKMLNVFWNCSHLCVYKKLGFLPDERSY